MEERRSGESFIATASGASVVVSGAALAASGIAGIAALYAGSDRVRFGSKYPCHRPGFSNVDKNRFPPSLHNVDIDDVALRRAWRDRRCTLGQIAPLLGIYWPSCHDPLGFWLIIIPRRVMLFLMTHRLTIPEMQRPRGGVVRLRIGTAATFPRT